MSVGLYLSLSLSLSKSPCVCLPQSEPGNFMCELVRRSQLARETNSFLRHIAWTLSVKQLRRDEWKKLARHWRFTEQQITAIQSTG